MAEESKIATGAGGIGTENRWTVSEEEEEWVKVAYAVAARVDYPLSSHYEAVVFAIVSKGVDAKLEKVRE